MLRIPLRPLVLALGTVGLLATAGAARDEERIGVTFGDFEILGNHHADKKTGRGIMEFVRKGDTIEHWHELLTIETFELSKWPSGSPDELLESMRAAQETACPGVTAWNVIARGAHRVVYEWQTNAPCIGLPPQREIAMVAFGKRTRFRIAYATKADSIPARDRDLWVQAFEMALVVSKGEPVWGPPSSEPAAFVQELLDSGRWRVGRQGVGGITFEPGSVLLFGDASQGETKLHFARQEEARSPERVQALLRTPIEVGVKSESEYSESCPSGYSHETLVDEPARKVILESFKGCKPPDHDHERTRVVLTGARDVFVWTDVALPSWHSEAERLDAIDSAKNVRLIEFDENGKPTTPAN